MNFRLQKNISIEDWITHYSNYINSNRGYNMYCMCPLSTHKNLGKRILLIKKFYEQCQNNIDLNVGLEQDHIYSNAEQTVSVKMDDYLIKTPPFFFFSFFLAFMTKVLEFTCIQLLFYLLYFWCSVFRLNYFWQSGIISFICLRCLRKNSILYQRFFFIIHCCNIQCCGVLCFIQTIIGLIVDMLVQ